MAVSDPSLAIITRAGDGDDAVFGLSYCVSREANLGQLWAATSALALVVLAFVPTSLPSERGIVADPQHDGLPPRALRRFGWSPWQQLGPVSSLSISDDGQRLLSTSADERIRLWDMGSGKLLIERSGYGIATLASDGELFAAGSGDKSLRIWRSRTGELIADLQGHEDFVWCVAFSKDGKLLASGSFDGTARLWRLSDGKAVLRIEAHTSCVEAIAFSPDGKTLATAGGTDEQVILWNAATGKEIRRFRGELAKAVAFSPDGTKFIWAGGRIHVCDAVSGEELQSIVQRERAVFSLAISPRGDQIASGADRNDVGISDLASGVVRRHEAHEGSVGAVAWSRDGETLVTGGEDGWIRFWDPRSGKQRSVPEGHGRAIESVSFSPDGTRIASASADAIRIWDAATGHPLMKLRGHGVVRSASFSPSGSMLATSEVGASVRLLDLATDKAMWVWKLPESPEAVRFSPDGVHLVSAGSDPQVCVWDVVQGRETLRLSGSGDRALSVAVSQDLIATGGKEGSLQVWGRTSGEPKWRRVDHRTPIQSLSFSSDGRLLASAGEDGMLILSEASTGSAVLNTSCVEAPARTLAFSPDDRVLVTGSWRLRSKKVASELKCGALSLWEVASGKHMAISGIPDRDVTSVACSPTESTFVSGTWDTRITLWKMLPVNVEDHKVLSDADFEMLWMALAVPDPRKAFAAVSALGSKEGEAAAKAIRLIGQRLEAAPGDDLLRRLLADLESDEIDVRETSQEQLSLWGGGIWRTLEKAKKEVRTSDFLQRIENLIKGLQGPVYRSRGSLQFVRAVWVLELLGSQGCMALLERISASDRSEAELQEARKAVHRLAVRKKSR